MKVFRGMQLENKSIHRIVCGTKEKPEHFITRVTKVLAKLPSPPMGKHWVDSIVMGDTDLWEFMGGHGKGVQPFKTYLCCIIVLILSFFCMVHTG